MRSVVLWFIFAQIVGSLVSHEICSEIKSSIVCELDSVTSISEQQDILADLCITLPNATQLIPTVQHRHVDVGQSLHSHCSGGTQGFLKWVSHDFYESVLKVDLVIIDTQDLVLHSDNINNVSVLIEVLPIHYILNNIQLKSPQIINYDKNIEFGSTSLYNNDPVAKTVDGSIPYGYQRRLNVRFVNVSAITGLSVSTNNASDLIDFISGHQLLVKHLEVNHFSKLLSAGDYVNATLVGTWTIFEYEIIGTLVSVFGNTNNETQSSSRTVTAKVTDIKVTKLRLNFNSTFEIAANESIIKADRNSLSKPEVISSGVYPGFRPYFYVACLVLFGTMFVVFSDVLCKLLNDVKARPKNMLLPHE